MKKEELMYWNKDSGGASSPITGFNDNLEFMGKQLHVQTENAGFPAAHIVTQVFCKGRVVMSRKSDYPPGIRERGDIGKMRELMHAQHFKIIQDIAAKKASILNSHRISDNS